MDSLTKAIEELTTKVGELEKENKKLDEENALLGEQFKKCVDAKYVTALEDENKKLKFIVDYLEDELSELASKHEALLKALAERGVNVKLVKVYKDELEDEEDD